jgi:hypothetical protein
MSKKNIITDTADGFFSLISTSYPRLDKVIRRVLELAVLVVAITWAATTFISVGGAVGDSFRAGTATVFEQGAALYNSGKELIGLSGGEAVPAKPSTERRKVITLEVPVVRPPGTIESFPGVTSPQTQVQPGGAVDSDVPVVQAE